MSLGGALSLHALRQHHPKIKSVFAQVPAGLHFYDRFDPKMKTQVFIVTHSGDIVSKLGFFPEHSACHMVQVKAEQIKGVIAHAQLLANHENSTCIKLDPQIENRSLLRRILSAVHLVFSWLIFIPLAICFLAYKVYRLVDIFLKRLSSCFQKSQLPTHVPMSLSM